MPQRLLALACALPLAASLPARADSCDRLTAKVIRVTGAALAGRAGTRAVFRATDAERMSLDCKVPARMVFASRDREPARAFYTLIGQAARAVTGAPAEAVETLSLQLHQDALLAGAPRKGMMGRAALRCETGARDDALAGDLTVCVLVPNRPPGPRRRGGRQRPGLPRAAEPG